MAVKIERRHKVSPGFTGPGEVFQWAADACRTEFEEFKFKDRKFHLEKDGKWLGVSCYQKAVRRGDVNTAVIMAQGLAELDLSYLLYRSTVIAVEDVGIGSPLTVAKVLAFIMDRAWVRQQNPQKVGSYLATIMASAGKDRNACDLLAIADWHPSIDRKRMQKYADSELATVLLDDSKAIPHRAAAAWLLAGTDRFKSTTMERKSDFGDLMRAYREVGMRPEIEYISKQGALMQREGHPIMLPLVDMLAGELTGEIKDDDLVELPKRGKFLSAAIDRHTREGKRSYAYFTKACDPIREFFKLNGIGEGAETNSPVHAIGVLMFRVEGHQSRMRLQYPMNDEIWRLADEAACFCAMGDIEQGMELLGLIRANLDVLAKARARIMQP